MACTSCLESLICSLSVLPVARLFLRDVKLTHVLARAFSKSRLWAAFCTPHIQESDIIGIPTTSHKRNIQNKDWISL